MATEKPSYDALLSENQSLKKLVIELMERIKLLEKQAGKNSENSSKPPSTDVFSKKKIQNNRVISGKKTGGQKGHKGITLNLVPTEEASEVIYLPVTGTCQCGADMSETGAKQGYSRRQVWDIPELKPYIKEYQLEKKVCSCGCKHQASCEEAPNPIQYGVRLLAFSSYLQNQQLLPVARTQELLSDIFGFTQVSEQVILDSSKAAYDKLAEWESTQVKTLQTVPVLHADETGMRVNGVRDWGHVCCTDTLTLYQHHEKRGGKAHTAHQIIPEFKGVLVHDRYSSYNKHECLHSFCNAHLLRELKSLMEEKQAWATEMYVLLNELHQGIRDSAYLETEYPAILTRGFLVNPMPERINPKGKIKKTTARNLLECFRDKKTEILRFFYQENVPFDNNQAERDLRMFKLKQKISGCFRTELGARIFCRVRSLISTLKKQGKNVWNNLCHLFSNPTQFVTIG